ncbi:MAG: M56 family metallopeptidase [Lachnospiraceae bacterium]|nr:M56 family metallopeptidase [Lachnospiraceae bacterium]
MPNDNFIGIFALFYEMLFKGRHVISAYAIMSCVFWSSLIILIYSLISESGFFIKISGGKRVLVGYILCMLQMFFPMDLSSQQYIVVKSMNPLGKLMMYRISLPFGEISVSKLMLMIWGIGIIVQTVRFMYGRIRMKRLIKSLPMTLMEIPGAVSEMMPRKSKAYICTGISVPMSVGIINRMILLPDREYDCNDICNIIRHESVHLNMYDHITVIVSNALCIIYWWNPCVYLLRRNMEKALEVRCDREAVKGMDSVEVAEYMSTLIKVFKNRYSDGQYAGLGMLGSGRSMRKELKSRFNALEADVSGEKIKGVNLLLTFILLGIMILSYRYVLGPLFLPEPNVNYNMLDNNGYIMNDNGINFDEPGPLIMVDDSTYIIDCGDGRYKVVNSLCEQEISEQWFDTLKDMGVRIK